jgi:aldehyde dehydrogenase (NAD+)
VAGDLTSGYFVPPTVLADVNDDMRIAKEEIFGPVASVLPFDDVDEAIRRASLTQSGLGGGVWTRDVGKTPSGRPLGQHPFVGGEHVR